MYFYLSYMQPNLISYPRPSLDESSPLCLPLGFKKGPYIFLVKLPLVGLRDRILSLGSQTLFLCCLSIPTLIPYLPPLAIIFKLNKC